MVKTIAIHTHFKIKEVRPGIFHFNFKNTYDLCMYFLRYQEYYESPSPKFRGKQFEIFDFMRWYSLNSDKKIFTYPDDWNGFNLPGNIIKDVHDKMILDRNIYDYEMITAWRECHAIAVFRGMEKFYIIGTVGKDALDHEIAHGLFYLNSEYQKKMKSLVKALPADLKKEMNHNLKRLGYTPKVYVDETQAYLATGFSESFEKTDQPDKWFEECGLFVSTFQEFSRKKK